MSGSGTCGKEKIGKLGEIKFENSNSEWGIEWDNSHEPMKLYCVVYLASNDIRYKICLLKLINAF